MEKSEYREIEDFLNDNHPDQGHFADMVLENISLKEAMLHHLVADKSIAILVKDEVRRELDEVVRKKGPPTVKNRGGLWKGRIRYLVAAAAVSLLV